MPAKKNEKAAGRMPVICVISDYDGRSVRKWLTGVLIIVYPKKCQQKIQTVFRKQTIGTEFRKRV